MGVKEILDPSGERDKQFYHIFDLVEQYARPTTDYAKLSHADFSSIHFFKRCLEVQASFMILLRTFATMYGLGFVPEFVSRKGHLSYREVLDWSRRLTPQILCESYCIYPHIELTTLLIDTKLEEVFLDAEMETRTQNRKLSSEFILLDWEGLDRTKDIQKLLQVDKIKSYNPREEEDIDIKQNALLKALEHWRDPTSLIVKDSRFPAFPLEPLVPMLPAEKEFWEGPMMRAWNQGRTAWMREVVPIFQGDKEIQGKVRDAQREQWRTIKRRRNIYESHQEQIKSELHPEDVERLNIHADVSADLVDVLRRAKKRWGVKAVKALRHLSDGKTEEEAAKLAGITARTLRNYKLKLYKDFSRKK